MGGFFGGLATSVGDQLDQAHKEGEAKKKELRDAYFKVWSDPNVSDAVRQDAWENLNKHVNPDAKKGLAKIAPIFGKLAGHGKQAPGQGQQGDQPQQQGAPPQQAPQPQGSPGEQAMAGAPSTAPQQPPSSPPPQQAQAAAAQAPPAPPPQPQRAASPGARAMQGPGMGQAYGADYGKGQREQVQTAADAAEARKLKTFGAEEGIRAATAKTQLQEKGTQFWQDSDKTMAKVSEIMADPKLSPEEKHAKVAVLGVNLPNPSPPEDVKNIPGDKLGAQKDAFGNAVDPKGVYTRGKDGKFYPEAPPPKAAVADKFTGELGQRETIARIIANPNSTKEELEAANATLKSLNNKAAGVVIRNEIGRETEADKQSAKSDAESIAKGIMNGTDVPDFAGLGRTGTGAKVRAILDREGYNLKTATTDYQAIKRHIATLNSNQQERLRQAITFASDSIPKIEDLYDNWKKTGLPSGFRSFNKAALVAASHLPGPSGVAAQTLLTQINDMTSEMGTVYKGGNSSTDESLKLASSNLSADWNEGQFKAAIDQMKKNLQLRKNSVGQSLPQGLNGPVGETPGSHAMATSIKYTDGNKSYNIPAGDEAAFLKDHPGAKKANGR